MPDNVIVVGELLQEHYLTEGPLRAVHTGRSAPAHIVAAELTACSVHCNSCGLVCPECHDRSTQASRHVPARRWSFGMRRRFSSARSHPSSFCPLPSTRCRTPAAICVSARGANERRSAGPRPGAAHPLAQLRLYLILLEHGLVNLLAHRQRLPPRGAQWPRAKRPATALCAPSQRRSQRGCAADPDFCAVSCCQSAWKTQNLAYRGSSCATAFEAKKPEL